jgi:tripartite-type tricarboxylate transporter receptor subunit TctC
MNRLLAWLLLALVPACAAAAYPEKPITIIVAYPPGGGTDVVARAIAPFLEKYLGGGAKFLVVNRSGAGGEVGFAAIANAPPDGYTIGFVNTPPFMSIPIERPANFGGPQRFELLGNIIDDPCNFSVHIDTPVKNLQELAAWARANPGKLTVGTTGVGSDDHLLLLMFERAAGVKMTHVPFKGSSEVRAAIMSKQIDVAAQNVGEALQSIRGGAQMRNLGQFGPARSNLAPDLPTGR